VGEAPEFATESEESCTCVSARNEREVSEETNYYCIPDERYERGQVRDVILHFVDGALSGAGITC